MSEVVYEVDPARPQTTRTGIYVRARDEHGHFGSADISTLKRESLVAWLLARPQTAARVVLHLLGYPLVDPAVAEKLEHNVEEKTP